MFGEQVQGREEVVGAVDVGARPHTGGREHVEHHAAIWCGSVQQDLQGRLAGFGWVQQCVLGTDTELLDLHGQRSGCHVLLAFGEALLQAFLHLLLGVVGEELLCDGVKLRGAVILVDIYGHSICLIFSRTEPAINTHPYQYLDNDSKTQVTK